MSNATQPPLALWQIDLLSRLQTDIVIGLNSFEASARRGNGHLEQLNTVSPPIDCPQWVCCLLPCIKHIPSMKLFDRIRPEDADVLRDSEWICYDAASLVVGDIICVREGEVVPADCVILTVGDPLSTSGSSASSEISNEELVVDSSHITGERPKTIQSSNLVSDQGVDAAQLYYGSNVLHGSGLAVVNAVGNNTRLGSLIRESQWPKFVNASTHNISFDESPSSVNTDLTDDDDDSAKDATIGSIALLPR